MLFNFCFKLTEGYSGSDIQLVCKEAAMRSVRKVFAVLENLCEESQVTHLKLDKITTEDVIKVLENTKPSARQLVKKYEAWTKEYESV
jgi:katanin p60 ATPase-containing subunit A1